MQQITMKVLRRPALILALVIASLILPTWQRTAEAAITWPEIYLGTPITGFSSPVFMTSARDGTGRFFVVEQTGTIRIVKGRVVQNTPFLDIRAKILCCGERGLLSLAFPPEYASRRHFYVSYTDTAGSLVIARYGLMANDDLADAASEQIVLTVEHPTYKNHNGGQLMFGPADGYLYVGTGDGGGAGDPNANGQNSGVLLGKILRIDVEGRIRTYSIPASNPFAQSTSARREIWAYGLRNPWRFSFDRQTADLYIGDVGQNVYEEVDFEPAGSAGGRNYGWNVMEGRHCYHADTCDRTGKTLPVTEYTHGSDCSVTGGFVYRGRRYPRLEGVYLYGDYCSGTIRGLKRDGTRWLTTTLLDTDLRIPSFGEDESGGLWVAALSSGSIFPIQDRRHVDDATYGITYGGWHGVVDLAAFGGADRRAVDAGQIVTYTTPAATSVGIVTYRGPDQGRALVTIDRVQQPVVDLYASSPQSQVVLTYEGLASVAHTISVLVLGQKQPSSTGNEVRVDGFVAGATRLDDSSPGVTFATWAHLRASGAYAGSYHRSATTGAALEFTVTGGRFTLIAARGPSYGNANVYVDGSLVTTIDLYSAAQEWQYRRAFQGFGVGRHVVRVSVAGTHNAASTGNSVVFDGFTTP